MFSKNLQLSTLSYLIIPRQKQIYGKTPNNLHVNYSPQERLYHNYPSFFKSFSQLCRRPMIMSSSAPDRNVLYNTLLVEQGGVDGRTFGDEREGEAEEGGV
jgi:hypothetical protein